MSRIIGISTTIYDIDGAIILKDILQRSTSVKSLTRRINKVATLDGGVIVEDRGFSEGDRNFEIFVPFSQTVHDIMLRLIKTYDQLLLTNDEGAFLVAPAEFTLDPKDELRFFFEVIEVKSA